MPEIVTLGETMIAMAPSGYGSLRYISDYKMRIAGAESNLAIGVSKLNHSAGWISRVGDDELGYFVRNQIRAEGVDTSRVMFDTEHRTGLMMKETSYAGETKVYYYRENSAASHMSAGDLDEEYIRQARIIHITGITPVLSDSCKELVNFCIDTAKKYGIWISFDPNIRRKLWKERDYTAYIKEIALQSEIVMLGADEAEVLFGTRNETVVFDKLFQNGNARYVAIKDGGSGAFVSDGARMIKIEPYPCKVLEPIGAGDGFNAGFLAGVLEEKDLELCGKMGAVAGALATETPGDIEGYPTREKMMVLLNSEREIYR